MVMRYIILLLVAVAIFSTPASAQDNSKNTIKSKQFGSWYYRCVKVNNKKSPKRCEVVQIAQTKQGKNTINLLTISLSELKNKKSRKTRTVITVLTPLNVFLPAGLQLKVGKSKANKLTYRNCNKAGCWIQHFVDAKLLRNLSRGKTAQAKLRLINGQNLNIKFSLKGLGSALKALKKG